MSNNIPEFSTLTRGTVTYYIEPPLKIDVKMGDTFLFFHDHSGLLDDGYATKENWRASLEAALAEEVDILYAHYASAPDETLANKALELKKMVLSRVTVGACRC